MPTINEIIAGDILIGEIQFKIHNLLESNGMTRKDLAGNLGVSEQSIDELFSDDPKGLTIRKIAQIFHILGKEVELVIGNIKKEG